MFITVQAYDREHGAVVLLILEKTLWCRGAHVNAACKVLRIACIKQSAKSLCFRVLVALGFRASLQVHMHILMHGLC